MASLTKEQKQNIKDWVRVLKDEIETVENFKETETDPMVIEEVLKALKK